MTHTPIYHTVSRERRAGVLLHPTSLPGPLGSGDIGHQAYRFIEFLHASGFKVWQMLPLGATHEDKSPYQCLSSHAGNPLLISLDWLEDRGWLVQGQVEEERATDNYRISCLRQAAAKFYRSADADWRRRAEEFTHEHAEWLHDYALFVALKAHHHGKPWYQWPAPLRQRDAAALHLAAETLQPEIQQVLFEQFIFFTQWHELHQYARDNQVELYGDLPLFVARDSADVWAQRENFLLDDDGEMRVVAGVPPDAFSDTGQRWGNPLFDWEYMTADGYHWWKGRVATQLELFDMIRIDHFRGLQACWHIPQSDATAINGSWVEVPGRQLLETLHTTFHTLPLVAEDLGVITDEVIALRNAFHLPGMKVLQFAFDGNSNNPHLPHNHHPSDTVYTGTHDNDTTLGWAGSAGSYNHHYFNDYVCGRAESPQQATWSMMQLAIASVSFLAMLPMQDLLMLDSAARMNTPGTVSGNWRWRFDWQQLDHDAVKNISHLLNLYQR